MNLGIELLFSIYLTRSIPSTGTILISTKAIQRLSISMICFIYLGVSFDVMVLQYFTIFFDALST